MSYIPRSLFSIISQLNREIFLPHIQRNFVWEPDQMSKLFDSLMRNYPVQTLLFWKTKEAIKTRKFMQEVNSEIDLHSLYDATKSEAGIEKTFVLDGQQRLQTLFCIYSGTIIENDSQERLEAYLKIDSSNEDINTGQIYNIEFLPSSTPVQLPYFRIKDLSSKYHQQSSEDISNSLNDELDGILNDDGSERKQREKIVRSNISKMVSILREDRYFWIEELDGVAHEYPYKTIVEIFIRVNSGGTKLDASDLMFAAMKELSTEIEANLEAMSTVLSTGQLNFEIDTILKCILLVNNKGATVDQDKFKGTEGKALVELIDLEWDTKYRPAFEALRDFIVTDLKLDSEKVIRSNNSLVPIFEYLFGNPTPTPIDKLRLKSFYYRAQLFNWFSAGTDGVLEYLHNNFLKDIGRSAFPIADILTYFSEKRSKKITFDSTSLFDHSLRFFILHLLYIENNGQSAFNVAMKNNTPHIDHIYPKSKLFREPFSLSPADINHIGNYRFVGATENIRKRAEEPISYFGTLKDANVNIARHLLLPSYSDNPSIMSMDQATYLDFRNRRSTAIFDIVAPIINYV